MADSDDPFLPSDLTARPRPGAGRRGAPDSGIYARPPGVPRVAEFEPIPEAARAFLGLGLNPLVQAASPLLLRMGQMRNAPPSLDVSSLRRSALDEIRRFEERARASGVRNEIVLAARYVLCAGLDEAVLSTPAGSQSEWAQHPLLVALHREAWGGEKFFEMLDRISADPARHIDLMELQYSGPRARLHGQVSDARSGPRAAGRSAAQPESHHQESARSRAPRSLAAVAGARRSTEPAHSLRAVVGGRRRRRWRSSA